MSEYERDLTEADLKIVRRFRNCCRTLDKIIADWKLRHPAGGVYNTPDSLNLMIGPTHDGDETSGWGAGGRPLQENVVEECTMMGLGGGDW